MDSFKAAVLGLVQGLTEFLPISSSGHLALVPWLFNWEQPGLAFDASLHLGTLLAVFFYFRVAIWRMVRAIPIALGNAPALLRNQSIGHPLELDARLGLLIAIGSIPGGLVGIAIEARVDQFFHSQTHQDRAMLVIAALLAGFAIVLLAAERIGRHTRRMAELNVRDAITIGLAQAVALIPGTSRSGITLTAGLWRNLSRGDAARFSFLLGLPLTLIAALSGLLDLIDTGIGAIGWGPLMIGIATSAISGMIAISWLLRLLQHAPTTIFTIYRIAAAAFVVFLIATGIR